MEDNGTLTRVAAFPIGMDPESFIAALKLPDVRNNISQLLNRFAGRKVTPQQDLHRAGRIHSQCLRWPPALPGT